jgi:Putative adhesin
MPQQHRVSMSLPAVLAALAGLFLITGAAQASSRQGNYTEEFHKVYPLSAQGRIEIENVNGPVHVTGWDRPEVKVDAVKSAWSKERLAEAQIEVEAGQDRISIRTQYPNHDRTFNYGGDDEHNNPARVEYTITVPRQANLDEIKLVNGKLDIQEVSGEVHASCVNGRIQARNLQGRTELNTVNGELEASVDQLPSSALKLSSVNGRLHVILPSDANAEVEASTMSGNISNDFGLQISRHRFVGRSMHGQLGGGGTLVKLSNVNGTIEISHASDNRPLSPARNLERDLSRNHDGDRDRDDDDND